MSDYKKTAEQILAAIGDKENIAAITHCATRLRLVLKDENKINTAEIEKIDLVKGHFLTAGQFQIILGTGIVNKVTAELIDITGISSVSTQEAKDLGAAKGNLLQRFIKTLSDVFVPIIPAIVAGGLLMGIGNVLTSKGLFFEGQSLIDAYPQWQSIAAMVDTFSNAPFVFLPVLIAFSATKIFGGNPILGAVLGMIMVHPALTNNYALANAVANNTLEYWELFGTKIAKVGYQGTVLPILVSSYILAKLEINLRKIIPQSLDLLLTPLLAVFITAFLTFWFVGPWARDAGLAFTNFIQWLYNTLGFVGGAVFGSIYAPIVITGMHNSFIPVETQLIADIASTGGTFIFPIAAMNNVAQGAAAFAVLFTVADKKLKSIASPSGVSAVLGITEPAMFGVNLRLRYPFYAALIGTAIASAFITLFKVKAVALGAAGIPGIISIHAQKITPYVLGMLISFGVTFALTLYFSKMQRFNDEAKPVVEEAPTVKASTVWQLPVEGQVIELKDIPDPVFSSGSMGGGFGVDPANGRVVAPADGTVVSVFPTKHAVTFESADGNELLIHIGIDTVNLKGEGFTAHVKDGDKVKAGDLLVEFDIAHVKANAPSAITIVVFPNEEGKTIAIENGQLNIK